MLLEDLLARRLVILTGKGGVGKSTVGAALALAARKRGKKVLLAEIDAPIDMAQRLGGERGAGPEAELLPGLFASNLRPREVMDEYVREVVKVELLYRRILESPVYARFFAAAPGLKELLVLGKILLLEESREGLSRRLRYDLIILDAPATGHGLSLLSIPEAAARAVPAGPVWRNARRILEMLQDPERTAVGLVVIPEEMAVVEAIELKTSLAKSGFSPRGIILNAWHERRFSAAEEGAILRLSASGTKGRLEGASLEGALLAARRQIRRRRVGRIHEDRLRRLGLPLQKLPFLYEPIDRKALDLLAERLEG
jgi:anion-transporting  ArsA/GET3 family ATPase